MSARSALAALLLLTAAPVGSQSLDDSKRAAVDLFERGDYPAAIRVLEEAAASDSLDAEYHYLLGYYTHYLCYDWRPVAGCDSLSDRVLDHLARAIALDPTHGNARYFIGAERGGRARFAMARGDWDGARAELRAARENGALPDWLIEYARNTLRSCGPDAILFAGGDAEVNPIQYLQLIEGYRTDVTLAPVALLDVPWYARLLKRGAQGELRAAPIEWTDEQIDAMRPYRWRSNDVEIPGAAAPGAGAAPAWTITVEPDLTGDRVTYLSASSALLVHIVEANRGRRPVHATVGCPRAKLAALEPYLQIAGLTRRMLPVKVEAATAIDDSTTAALLLDRAAYENFSDVAAHDMSHVSPILQNYRAALLQLAASRAVAGDAAGARAVVDSMAGYMPESALPMPPQLREAIDKLRASLTRTQ